MRSDVALAIEHPGVVRYLAGIFDHAWQRASPLRDVRPAGPGGLPAPLAYLIARSDFLEDAQPTQP
ncbi:hypothetical protein [Streptomyces sp. NBC_01294]|uniref:hypothetical protein n=1 Tax=Streptomyces sp. NBC_01294 TaxID=2903815 RepID=UPI002DDB04ED|nr:hypothetical protein [Streptomyces sp. NBC_01294]WRZ58876.1 hypothetical protein OG534_21715 [Streptomyces sp. NBC_01294]